MPLPLRLGEPGPLLSYLQWLRSADPKAFDQTIADVRFLLGRPEAAILLDLLEKSTVQSLLPILADPRALEARNAQSLILRDLRRIMSDETEQLVQQQDALAARGRGRPRRID